MNPLAPIVLLALAGQPAPDHVVIVVEENKHISNVIGNPDAPFINTLCQQGSCLTDMYGLTHPSQPNYLHLFSGAHQGVFDNTVPAPGSPFTTPNLAANLLAAGRTFVSYCEDLPEAGSAVGSSGWYERKHNPCVNWQNSPAGPNQYAPALNQPFTSFPTGAGGYGALPTVSLVVPNQLNDMHDGTIAQGDAWLQEHLGGYAQWCMTHNSLLVVTFDEDDSVSGGRNRIPTLLYGPMVRPGANSSRWTLHNLLRTIEDLYQAGHAGAAADVRSIVGSFLTDPDVETAVFQQGEGGYSGTADTYVEQAAPDASHASAGVLVADGSPFSQCLVRFGEIFGTGPGRVPAGVDIVSAKLSLLTGSTDGSEPSSDAVMLHRMLTPWAETATYRSLGSGVTPDGAEAVAVPDFGATPNVANAWVIFDVTASLRAWSLGQPNHGWLVQPTGSDGWRFASAQAALAGDRPMLHVTYRRAACDPDYNNDGNADQDDVTALIQDIAAGTSSYPGHAPDFNVDGNADQDDVVALIQTVAGGGCP